MPLRSEFLPLLADPSEESWRAIVGLLDARSATQSQRLADARAILPELRGWPPEVERRPGDGWSWVDDDPIGDDVSRALLALCRSVREVDLYRYYVAAAAGASELRLRDGTPAVRLERAFTGALQGAGGAACRVGAEGQGDLRGSLCVEWLRESVEPTDSGSGGYRVVNLTHRLSVALEVEVKRGRGKLRPAQGVRRDALLRRGELYLVVRRVADMVAQLVAERDRLLMEVGARVPSAG